MYDLWSSGPTFKEAWDQLTFILESNYFRPKTPLIIKIPTIKQNMITPLLRSKYYNKLSVEDLKQIRSNNMFTHRPRNIPNICPNIQNGICDCSELSEPILNRLIYENIAIYYPVSFTSHHVIHDKNVVYHINEKYKSGVLTTLGKNFLIAVLHTYNNNPHPIYMLSTKMKQRLAQLRRYSPKSAIYYESFLCGFTTLKQHLNV